MPDAVVCCSILMYADDTVLFYSAKDVVDLENVLNAELQLIQNWLQMNNLFLNTTKTEVVLFGTDARLANVENFQVTIGHHHLKRVLEYKYLGVVLDENLSWKSHVKYIISKAGKRIGLLGRVRQHLTTNAANLIYRTFILPVMDYCDYCQL